MPVRGLHLGVELPGSRGWWCTTPHAEQSRPMGSLHSAVVAVTDICVVIVLVAWVVGAVYCGVKSRNGPGPAGCADCGAPRTHGFR
ncbi:hypothetical protein San01_12060 [Streptomyces angustmyceticus]|uniref:Uncharacterized protein n=1 Tax=Streptomyces angustmyceticus TaxID=285578 RepID=A0A5J4LAZ8_9ACTN|nr:hypothetical protein San01_12060 [Streptomyces angustmyceticus]